MKNKIIKYSPFIFVLLFAIFVSRHLFLPGFVPTHDGEYHIIRFWQFDKAIGSGNLFPLWAPDLDFDKGVPIFAYFYPLPNYIAEIFVLLGFSYVKSLHMVLASGLIFSAFSFYLWTKTLFGRWAGLVGSVFYTLAPYHLVDVFVRGSVGEVWALALAPLSLYFATKLIKEKKYVVVNSIILYLLLLSHNILGPMFYAFIILYGIVLLNTPQGCDTHPWGVVRVFVSYLIGLLLSLYFWLPVVFDRRYVQGLEIVNISDHFPALYQLLFPSWGTGFSGSEYGSDQMSFQIGIPHLFVVIIGAALVLVRKKRRNIIIIYMLLAFIVSVLLMLKISYPIWEKIAWMTYFQFPWRLMSVVILVSSFMASYATGKSRIIAVVLIVVAVIFYLPYTKPVVYEAREDSFYLNNPTWTQGTATTGNVFRSKSEDRDLINNSLARKTGNGMSIISIGVLFLVSRKMKQHEKS